jgi:hypothetical protein
MPANGRWDLIQRLKVNQKFMKRPIYISLFHQLDVDVLNVTIKRGKFWCLVGLFQVTYAPCYVTSDEKGA